MIKCYEKNSRKYYEVYVAARDTSGKLVAKRRRNIRSEREAKDVEFAFKTELKAVVDVAKSMSWSQWHTKFLERNALTYKNSTLRNYDFYLSKYIPAGWKNKPINEITSDDVRQMLVDSSSRLGLVSQKNILKMLRMIFNTAMIEGLIDRLPTDVIIIKTPTTIKKVLTSSQVEILLKNAKETNHSFYPIWVVAVMTGMRSGEMFALKWENIDFETMNISVSEQWTSKDGYHELKTADWRIVPMSRPLRDYLQEYRRGVAGTREFVLPHLQAWEHGEQAAVLRQFCECIGIPQVRFHDLRATFITNLLAQGVPLVKVMSIVGHKKMETTDVYLRLAGVEIKGVTEALGYQLPETADVGAANVIRVEFGKT